jgi:signal transduction histidine kinase
VKTALFRIVQEALNNVVKHANTKKANVFLKFEPATVSVEVADEGRGFDLQAAGSSGRVSWGLKNMEERAVLLGGRFTVQSRPGEGTKVEVSIPLIDEVEVPDDDPPVAG